MATKPEDVRGTKLARTEFGRRGVDLTMADVRCMHGLVHVRGTISKLAGANIPSLKAECEHIAKILKTKEGIRDVVLDCIIRG